MALPFRVLCLTSKVGILSGRTALSASSCRIARGDVSVWMAQRYSHRYRDVGPRQTHEMFEEPEVEDAEVKLQALLVETKKWQKTVKHHKIKKQMTTPGAPERRLSWDAIEQIRYLKRERPEEWTVERLAEGFSVTPCVIIRVLRSKLNPTPERKARQDAKVKARCGQQALSPGSRTEDKRPQLPAEGSPAALVTAYSRALLPAGKDSRALVASSGGPPSILPTQLSVSSAVFTKHVTAQSAEGEAVKANAFKEEIDEEDEEEDMWDGQVFTEEEIEEMMPTAKLSPVVQIGKDFFDADSNFLYRI